MNAIRSAKDVPLPFGRGGGVRGGCAMTHEAAAARSPRRSSRRFAGRNAIVTGASRGVGAGIAERLAAEGAQLVVVARTDGRDHLEGSLNETVQQCRRYGVAVKAISADLADPVSRAAIVPRALEFFSGRIDILVNNA